MASYAHMCRDGHIEIGHNDSEHELCPLCRMTGEAFRLQEVLDAASYYIDRLEAVQQRRVVRDMTEAMEGYHQAKRTVYSKRRRAAGG